jgi:tRNA(adenine34) deaminase
MDHINYLTQALKEAELALSEGNVPIGAVIVKSTGEIIARSHNKIKTSFDATSHAEVNAIREAGELVIEMQCPEPTFLYTTLEPCFACSFFITRTNIKNVVWALSDPYKGGFIDLLENDKIKDDLKEINYTSEPYLDIKKRARNLYLQYCREKGYDDRLRVFESIE